MTVSLGVELRVRVRHCPRECEGRHERNALAHTGREIGTVELVEPLTRAMRLHVIAPPLADAGQDEAARVVERAGADAPRPASVVPGDANGDVVERQTAGAGRNGTHREISHAYSSTELVSSAAFSTSVMTWRRNRLRSREGVTSGTGAAGS